MNQNYGETKSDIYIGSVRILIPLDIFNCLRGRTTNMFGYVIQSVIGIQYDLHFSTMQQERDQRTHGFRVKRAFRNAFTYGLALEVLAIGSGYILYREYKANKGRK